MTRFVLGCLAGAGFEPVVAYYAPYSVAPELSVPFYRIFERRVGVVKSVAFDGVESYGIGAWFPELEFTHYLPTRHWRELMESCEYFVAVSGNILAALPYAKMNKPFVAWVATPWYDDRAERVKNFPFARLLLDRFVNSRVIQYLEKYAIRQGTILALSEYTSKKLSQIAGPNTVFGTMGHPVDTGKFAPAPEKVVRGRVGFVGRFDDPRKNASLFIDAIEICRKNNVDITGILVGGEPDRALMDHMKRTGMIEQIKTVAYVSNDELPELLQTLDIFVIPSHQEGLCIAALEAMACGIPVVSTRCGGPEEYVEDDVTGYLVTDKPAELAERLTEIYVDRSRRDRLGRGARRCVETRYNRRVSEDCFWNAFLRTFET